jgi:hypothetical protein
MTLRRWLIASAIAAAALLLVGRVAADVYSSYAWYDALGATAVWRAQVATTAMLRAAAWIAASLYALAHLFTVRKSIVSLVVQRQLGDLEIPESVHGRYLTWSVVGLALLLGGLLALSPADWTTAFLAANGGAFNEYDNYFGADLGFFVFWLPFEVQVWTWSAVVVLVTTAVVIVLYVVTAGVRIENGALRFSGHARRHLTVILGILLLLLSWNFRLEMYQLLLGGTGPGGAFGYFDHRVAQHGALILSLVALAAGVVVMMAGVNSARIAFIATACVLVLWVAARQLAPAIAGRAASQRDPSVREREYLATQAGYSRRAFAIDRIRFGDSAGTYGSIDAALSNTALWSDAMLRRAIDPRRALDTSDIWIGWRPSPKGPVADVVRREGADPSREVWSVTSIEAATADIAGDLVVFSDSPGRVGPSRGSIRPPLIYPGAQGYQEVPDSSQRMVGMRIDSRLARLAYAWSLQSPDFLTGEPRGPRTTLIDVRDVRDRLRRLTPFFEQGSVVTPLVVGDSIFWTVDLYAASNWYPLSVRVSVVGKEWRYFQHAAVAVVDGSTGDVMIVPDDTLDPLTRVWVGRFQSIFTTAAALPAGVRAMLPSAIDGARAQAEVFGRFAVGTTDRAPRHLPGAESDGLAVPALGTTSDRGALLASFPLLDSTGQVRGVITNVGGESRQTTWFPATNAARPWTVVASRLKALDSAGGRVVAREPSGVTVALVDHQVIYIQPVFAMSSDAVPSLAYIGVHAADSTRKFGPVRHDGLLAVGDLHGQVQAIHAAMRAALQRNDWIAFGRAMDALSRIAGNPAGGRR